MILIKLSIGKLQDVLVHKLFFDLLPSLSLHFLTLVIRLAHDSAPKKSWFLNGEPDSDKNILFFYFQVIFLPTDR